MKQLLAAFLVVAAVAIPSAHVRAQSAMRVFAAPGPQGMTVRWLPARLNEPLIAHVVRIAPDGSRVALRDVQRPMDTRSAAFNASVDRKQQGAIAAIGPIETALVRGIAFIDAGARNGLRYRYDITLSDGERGNSNLTPPAGAKPRAGRMAVDHIAAVSEDRKIRIVVTPAIHSGFIRVFRSDGGPYQAIAMVPCQGEGNTVYEDRAQPGTRYSYRVAWIDIFGNTGPQSMIVGAIAKDLHQPMPVLGVRVRSRGAIVSVSWQRSTDRSLAGYDVYRAAANSRAVRIASVSASRSSYQDRVTPGSIVQYDVRARTVAGIEGMPSSGASLLVSKTLPPDAPAALVAKPLSDGVELSWRASRDPTVDRYNVYRRAEQDKRSLLAQVPASARAFEVRMPKNSLAAYAYGIGAQDRFGNRVMPNRWVEARPLRTSLPQSASPIKVRAHDGIVSVYVAPLVDPDLSGQRLYRSEDGRSARAIAKLAPKAARYDDRAVRAGHRYAYALAAIASNGSEGKRSAQVSVQVPAPLPRAPTISARLLRDGMTVELRWPQSSGIVGYMVLRRGPNGATATIAPFVAAFAYRDVLPEGAHGSYAYAVRIVTRSGVSPLGPFTSVSIPR
ncbi:MAG: fibronectin type III domain-containing protein [Vulcanimicrobiaceae bacterium]